MGYSFRLAARVLLYASSHRQDNTYHGVCYTSRGALAGTRNSSMGPPWRIDPTTHRIMGERSYYGATSRSFINRKTGTPAGVSLNIYSSIHQRRSRYGLATQPALPPLCSSVVRIERKGKETHFILWVLLFVLFCFVFLLVCLFRFLKNVL